MKDRKIRTKLDLPVDHELGGWLSGKRSYIGVYHKKTGACVANLGGYKLYRLAKAIINHWES